jgi:hypothetical protein
MEERRNDPVARFLSSAIVWARGAHNSRADRLALIASDLIAKARTLQEDGLLRHAREMGFVGLVDGSEPQNAIAAEVLARSQKALDGDDADPQAVAAGLQACRRLIVAEVGPGRRNLRLFYTYLQLGVDPRTHKGQMLAPARCRGEADMAPDPVFDVATGKVSLDPDIADAAGGAS